MKLKNLYCLAFVSLLFATTFISCNDDDDPITPAEVSVGAYILNTGGWGTSDANIVYYDFSKKTVSGDIYKAQNGQMLGDLGNDILVYGSKMYVAVCGSDVIDVLDLNCNLIKSLKAEDISGNPKGPRCLTEYDGKVYVSFFNSGHLGQLDTTHLTVSNVIKVGANPEGLVGANKKIYVANSGGYVSGYEKTVSVVDVNKFELIKDIEVVVNPMNLVKDNQDDVYLVSMGNYSDIPNTLQRIDTETDAVTKIGNATMITSTGDKLYMIYAQYGKPVEEVKYIEYDAINEKESKSNFITDGTVIQKPYSISYDKSSGDIYIGESDYKTNGTMYIFSSAGKKQNSFDTGGLNPIKVAFVAK